ncbi:GNAT family N-acetyltransferase [Rummeliibacillus stabekisii]|uniref:GNAT family N-acetyltransferase n=1 Tax=Rummeliibacillus stabekisii TaxID=241244 RepID=UPI0011714A8D|nr:GNAT family N-acetyltransferase [Rummeliibacillus stabekisii]MBB5171343.1 ribosomal protein S18 acetylase RimI-like enzyme [Rummeliibacillus stabekisii]GEL06359.1 N-acetyltransferase [Rummeliibacillus stabekisii]
MIKEIDMTKSKFANEVLNVQLLSYKVEAELIDFYELPPLKDTVESLQQSGETFYGFYIKEELSGIISIKIEEGVMDIHRLFVHPKHFRKGIARELLDFIQSIRKEFQTIIVSTSSKNAPAINFYKKNGFVELKEMMVDGGLTLTMLEKKLQ